MSSYSFQGRPRIWTPRFEDDHRTNSSKMGLSNLQERNAVIAEQKAGKWNVLQLIRLLRFYRAHSCLWNTTNPDYHDRKLRHAALIDITTTMGSGFSRAQVLRKINVLRATYRYEKRRIKQRIEKGFGATTKLKWFSLADSFLRKVAMGKNHSKGVACQNAGDDSDLEDTVVANVDPETIIPIQQDDDGDSGMMNQSANVEIIEEPEFWTLVSAKCNDGGSKIFVNLLLEHTQLWDEDFNLNEVQLYKTSKIIAEQMCMPTEYVIKKVQMFSRIIRVEKCKMLEMSTYKPSLPWWPYTDFFSKNLPKTSKTKAYKSMNFIDIADFNPLKSVTNCTTIDTTEDDKNPISLPRSMVASVTVEEQLEKLYKDSIQANRHVEIDNSKENGTCAKEISSSVAKPNETWIDLQDDLLEGKWSLKHSVRFLRLYGAHKCLWDRNDPHFRDRELRRAAISDIAAAMKHGLTAYHVAKKIKIFRITYMQQRKRMLEAKKQGKESAIQLRWFPLADSFLRPHIGLRSIKNNDGEMPQFDYQYVVANLNLIDPTLLTDFHGKGTQNTIDIGGKDGILDGDDE